jgi:NTE family protein
MKQTVLFIILTAFNLQICSPQNANRPKVAVVLSGGGAKGFAHIGVLKVLEEEGIPIDIIVGTSMGSIVGGLYSIGYSADNIGNMALSENWSQILSDYIPRKQLDQYSRIERQRYVIRVPMIELRKPSVPNGLIRGQNILNLFCGLTANVSKDANFSDFPISFACISTDLETGEEIVLNSGFLPTAMFSSMAIPGVFIQGEHNGHRLIDGGFVNNFPTDVAKKMGADIIIGVDIRTDLHTGSEIVSLNMLMNQLINFYAHKKDSVNKSLCDIVIRPNIDGYSVSSFYTSAVDTLIERGIKSAKENIEEIRNLKSKYNLQPKSKSSALIKPDEWQINDISISGNYSMPDKFLKDGLDLDIPGKYSYNEIKKSINSLHGTGHFKRAYFNLNNDNEGKILNIMLDEEKTWDVNVGMRLNSRSAVSIVLNSSRKDYTKTFGLLSFTVDISSNPRINFLFELDKKELPKIALMIDGMFKNLNIHLDKDQSFPTELYVGSAKVFSSKRVTKYSIIGSGIKQEYYNGKLYSVVTDSNPTITSKENSITNFFGYLIFDNLDDYYFPTKGTEVYSEVSLAQDMGFHHANPIVLFKMRNIFKLGRSYSILLNIYGRSVLTETAPGHLGNFVGGHDYEILLDHHLPFYGLPSLWPTGRYTYIGLTGLRVNVAKRHYITLVGNYLIHNNEFSYFNSYKTIWGSGLTYSYKSPIGPIEITAGYSDQNKKPTLSANIGFWF